MLLGSWSGPPTNNRPMRISMTLLPIPYSISTPNCPPATWFSPPKGIIIRPCVISGRYSWRSSKIGPGQLVLYHQPPVALAQIKNQSLQIGNLSATCKPSLVVATGAVIEKLEKAGYTEGPAYPLYQDRGIVILVKKGNPKNIRSVWDLGAKRCVWLPPTRKWNQGLLKIMSAPFTILRLTTSCRRRHGSRRFDREDF